MTPRRWLAILALSVIDGLAAVGLLAMLWFVVTPNDAIVSWIGWR